MQKGKAAHLAEHPKSICGVTSAQLSCLPLEELLIPPHSPKTMVTFGGEIWEFAGAGL